MGTEVSTNGLNACPYPVSSKKYIYCTWSGLFSFWVSCYHLNNKQHKTLLLLALHPPKYFSLSRTVYHCWTKSAWGWLLGERPRHIWAGSGSHMELLVNHTPTTLLLRSGGGAEGSGEPYLLADLQSHWTWTPTELKGTLAFYIHIYVNISLFLLSFKDLNLGKKICLELHVLSELENISCSKSGEY